MLGSRSSFIRPFVMCCSSVMVHLQQVMFNYLLKVSILSTFWLIVLRFKPFNLQSIKEKVYASHKKMCQIESHRFTQENSLLFHPELLISHITN